MKQRGRKSAAAKLAVIDDASRAMRPEPPAELGEDERAVWWRIVNAMPAGWFTEETHDILASYCRSVVTVSRLDERIAQLEEGDLLGDPDLDRLGKFCDQRDKRLRTLMALGRSLRITLQALDAKTSGRVRVQEAPAGPKPWDG